MDYAKLKKSELIEVILQKEKEIESLQNQLSETRKNKAGRKPDKTLPNRIQQAQFMRFNGYGVNEIAKEMNVSRQTVSTWLKTEI